MLFELVILGFLGYCTYQDYKTHTVDEIKSAAVWLLVIAYAYLYSKDILIDCATIFGILFFANTIFEKKFGTLIGWADVFIIPPIFSVMQHLLPIWSVGIFVVVSMVIPMMYIQITKKQKPLVPFITLAYLICFLLTLGN